MRNFEGTVRVRVHPEKGVMLTPGVEGSTLTAADADKLLNVMLEGATKHKVGIDRWSLFAPAITLPEGAKQVPAAEVVKLLKTGLKPRLRQGKWGKPCLVIAAEQESTKRKSSIIDLA